MSLKPEFDALKDGNANVFANEGSIRDEFKYVNNSELVISPEIQRKLVPARVARIIRYFSPYVVNPIKASYRNGRYYIFDGSHTRTALVHIHGTEDFPVLCRVFYGLTEEDEARLFAMQSGFCEEVPMPDRLKALVKAKDPEMLDFMDVTESSGFTMSPGVGTAHNGHISAVCEAFKAYRSLGGKDYARMLKTLYKTWAGESWSVCRYMLGGMSRFMRMYDFDMRTFVKVFRKVTYREIKNESRNYPDQPRDAAFAEAIACIFDQKANVALKEHAGQ